MVMDPRIVLIIGGSSGIGHEAARQSSAQGARLIIVGRNQAKLTAAAETQGPPSDQISEGSRGETAPRRDGAGAHPIKGHQR